MSVFNPQIQPTQDPNYLNYSRVLDAPTPDMSGKIGLETAAQGLDSAVSITDTAIKRGISDKAYAAVDPKRDEMTAGLEKIKANLNQGIVPQPQKPGQPMQITSNGSWLDANAMAPDIEDNLPVGLADGIGGVQSLAAAKAAGSPKLNDTQYAGEVLSEAKRLRNQYGPGYREYIDQKISEASGLPVANSYYNNMLLDINRQMAQMNKTKDDVGAMLLYGVKEGVPGMADMLNKRRNGVPINESDVYTKVGDWQNTQKQITIDAAIRKENADRKADIADTQAASLSRNLNNIVQMNMSAIKDSSIGGTLKDYQKFQSDYISGKLPNVTEADFNAKRLAFNNYVTKIQSQVEGIAAGYTDVITPTEAANRVKSAMAPLLAQQTFVNSKEDGPAFFITHQVEHIKADAVNNFLLNKDTSKESAVILGARYTFGDLYMPKFIDNMAGDGVMQKYAGMINQERLAAITPYTDSRNVPITRYHVDAIKHAKSVGAEGDSGVYGEKGVTKLITEIADPDMTLPAKDKIINYAFNSKNVGRLEELKMDYRDPNTGNWVDGRYRMFNILGSESINKAVRETSAVHPDNYKMYRNTMETEFGRLYRSTLVDLNQMVMQDKGNVGLHFSFNDKTNQFGLVDKSGRPVVGDPQYTDRSNKPGRSITPEILGRLPPTQYQANTYVSAMLDKVSLINGGLASMARIHQNDPSGTGDIGKYLLQTLQTANLRPGSNISGATEDMMKAVIKTKNPEMTPQDLDKAVLGSKGPAARSNFTQEEDNSLASFLRSPAGRRGESLEPYQTRGVIQGNLSDHPLLGIKTDDIPEGMSARDFIAQLKKQGKF